MSATVYYANVDQPPLACPFCGGPLAVEREVEVEESGDYVSLRYTLMSTSDQHLRACEGTS